MASEPSISRLFSPCGTSRVARTCIYHVTSRGDRREPIFEDNEERHNFLGVVGRAMERFDAVVLAYCLMDNPYHIVVHTRRANLSRLMQQLNGVYTHAYNPRHGKVGHLFQGRFKGRLVDENSYLSVSNPARL